MCEEVTASRWRSGRTPRVGGVDGEHGGAGADAAALGLRDHLVRPGAQRAHARVLEHARAGARSRGRAARARAAPGARWRRRARRHARRNSGEAQRSATAARSRPASLSVGARGAGRIEQPVQHLVLGLGGGGEQEAARREPGVDALAPRTRRRSAATLSSEARAAASARSAPKRSTRSGRFVHSVSAKPPLRPLGPWPHTSASSSATLAPRCSSCHAVHRPA